MISVVAEEPWSEFSIPCGGWVRDLVQRQDECVE